MQKSNKNYPIKNHTLGYLVKNNQVLLAMKKRGFGEGKLNGIGGKVQIGETIEQALVRETEEEIGVTPTLFEKVAILDFYYPGKDGGVINRVYTFLITDWKGKIKESAEMKPDWYKINNIPIDKMWPSDRVWLSKILSGEKLNGEFFYDVDFNFLNHKLKTYVN